MFSKLCSPNQVMGGCRTHSVSALLLVCRLRTRGNWILVTKGCFIRSMFLILTNFSLSGRRHVDKVVHKTWKFLRAYSVLDRFVNGSFRFFLNYPEQCKTYLIAASIASLVGPGIRQASAGTNSSSPRPFFTCNINIIPLVMQTIEVTSGSRKVGVGGPGPLAPKIFFKIMQFSANLKENPYFGQILGSGPPGVKTPLAPWPKSWIRHWNYLFYGHESTDHWNTAKGLDTELRGQPIWTKVEFERKRHLRKLAANWFQHACGKRWHVGKFQLKALTLQTHSESAIVLSRHLAIRRF